MAAPRLAQRLRLGRVTVRGLWASLRLPAARQSIRLLHDGVDASAETFPTTLSERRLQEFLDAEVTHFAAMKRQALTLEDLLQVSTSLKKAAEKVHTELPKHFAARIRQLELLEGWKEDPDLLDLHSRYSASFQELRMAELREDTDLSDFTDVVRKLKERQRPALRLIGQVLQRRKQSGKSSLPQEWLGPFLRSRISSEMLTSQYVAIVSQVEKGASIITGIVQPECDPAVICRASAEAVRQLCSSQTGVMPAVNIEVRSKRSHAFSYIPMYLHYILTELLKNSVVATAKAVLRSNSCLDPVMEKSIHVVICSDDHRVAIRISDLAGGIPFDVGRKVWEFGFTGSTGDFVADPSKATALHGYGLGLPLARLYAEYLGGSLTLISLPDYGVDAYLFLPRIDLALFLNEVKEDAG